MGLVPFTVLNVKEKQQKKQNKTQWKTRIRLCKQGGDKISHFIERNWQKCCQIDLWYFVGWPFSKTNEFATQTNLVWFKNILVPSQKVTYKPSAGITIPLVITQNMSYCFVCFREQNRNKGKNQCEAKPAANTFGLVGTALAPNFKIQLGAVCLELGVSCRYTWVLQVLQMTLSLLLDLLAAETMHGRGCEWSTVLWRLNEQIYTQLSSSRSCHATCGPGKTQPNICPEGKPWAADCFRLFEKKFQFFWGIRLFKHVSSLLSFSGFYSCSPQSESHWYPFVIRLSSPVFIAAFSSIPRRHYICAGLVF